MRSKNWDWFVFQSRARFILLLRRWLMSFKMRPPRERNDFLLIKTLIWDPIEEEICKVIAYASTQLWSPSFLRKKLLRHLRNAVIFNSATADLFREWAKVIYSCCSSSTSIVIVWETFVTLIGRTLRYINVMKLATLIFEKETLRKYTLCCSHFQSQSNHLPCPRKRFA